MNKINGILIFILITIFLIQAKTISAYEIEWSVIQHRVYESGDTRNILAFEITDGPNNYVSSASVVTGVVLKSPSDIQVNLSNIVFYPRYDYYRSNFDTVSNEWVDSSPLQLSDFQADVLDPLTIGFYTLEVSMDNSQLLSTTINFDYLLDLPIISSKTFQIYSDTSGNIHWTWVIPDQLLALANSYDVQVRAGVAAMNNGNLVALYFPVVPVEMGYSITPSSIYQDLVDKADEIRFGFQVRTQDNNARSYSKRIIIKPPSYSVSVSPKKDANFFVIPVHTRQ